MVKVKRIFLVFLLFFLACSFLTNLFLFYQYRERDRVVRVVDGDSFQTKDGRRIRLLGLDAPERSQCMYQEAKEKLTTLTLDKHVKLTDKVTDDYGRILANVFIADFPPLIRGIFVNRELIKGGFAKFAYVSSPYYNELKELGKQAKSDKTGIYSDSCRGSTPNSECVIKGNVTTEGVRLYHLPSCLHYNEVIVDRSYGDRWFCTENEAIAAGFRKAAGC